MRRAWIVLATVLLLSSAAACTRLKSRTKASATCGIGGACWVCPDADAAMLCLSKLDGTAAGCTRADAKECR